MMTSSNGNIFRFTDPLWGESTGQRWIPLTKASDDVFFGAPEQTIERTTGDLRRHRAHYNVAVM